MSSDGLAGVNINRQNIKSQKNNPQSAQMSKFRVGVYSDECGASNLKGQVITRETSAHSNRRTRSTRVKRK